MNGVQIMYVFHYAWIIGTCKALKITYMNEYMPHRGVVLHVWVLEYEMYLHWTYT